MADLRVKSAVKLLNEADNNQLLPDAAALADNAANPTTSLIGACGLLFDGSTWDRAPGNTAGGAFMQGPAAHDAVLAGNPLVMGGGASAAAPTGVSADGDAVQAWFLRNGAQATVVTAAGALIGGDATNGLDVDVTRVTGTVTVDSELPAAAALADSTANPTVPGVGAFALGFNGTTWDRIKVANGGRPQVDIVTGGGADTPTTPVTDLASSSGTAAGATANLDSADVGGTTKKLWQADVTSSVAWKATIGAYENGALVKQYTTLFGPAGAVVSWKPPHREFASRAFSANAGFDGFRAVFTNMDASSASDGYAAFHYSTA